jgi:hypothetical protein
MNYPARAVIGIAVVALCAAACETSKSSNPLSPSVAGPIAGVTITAPKPITPTNGSQVTQGTPVTLVLENATSTSARPFWQEIQVSLDGDFTQIVHTAPKVALGSGGRTSYIVPITFTSNRAYFWRARAADGANTGPYSANSMFTMVDPVHIEAPLPTSPIGGVELPDVVPTFVLHNTAATGTSGVVYRVELAADAGFAQMIAVWQAPRSGGDSTTIAGTGLAPGTTYFWRANATDGATTSPYSDTENFKTKGTTTTTPPPSGGGGGGGGSTGGPWPTTGDQVIAWAQAHYPDYLKPSSNRVSNMMFLRDRMIEAGNCGGMKLGYNAKRGGPEISVDYITENVGGRWVGVDIAHDYDNQAITLQLTWAEQPDDPYASYTPYTGTLPCK